MPEEPVIELTACRTTIAMLRQGDYVCPSSTGFTMDQIGEMIAACLIGAEGVAAETLLVIDGRESFANFVDYERLYGNAPRPPMKPFAPCLGYAGRRTPRTASIGRVSDCRRARPDP